MNEKFLIAFFISVLILFGQVLSQKATVQAERIYRQTLPQKIIEFFVKYSMWIVLFFLFSVLAVFIYLLIKNLKKRVDPFKAEFIKVRKLAKLHKIPTYKKVYAIGDGFFQFLGHYLGECYTQDGYLNFLVWKRKKWYLFWVPTFLDFFDLVKDVYIIRVNMNKTFREKVRDPQTKEEKIITHQLATDLVFRHGDKVVIKCWGVEPINYFYYPILRDKEGNLIDKSLEVFEREKDRALIKNMYYLTEDFSNVARELININPTARWKLKTGETPRGD